MSSSPEFTVRTADQSEIPALVQLLEAYMPETFKVSWRGSAEALRRDGFGREFETHVAVTGNGQVIGFVAWTKSYDLHHCLTGGYILDLYVAPASRGRGVAPACRAAPLPIRWPSDHSGTALNLSCEPLADAEGHL